MNEFERDLQELREACPEIPEERLPKLSRDLDELTKILFDYFIEQRKHGRTISDPWQSENEDPGSNNTNGVCG